MRRPPGRPPQLRGCGTTCSRGACRHCDGGQCVSLCSACEVCDGAGSCVPRCSAGACELCDGAGNCAPDCDPVCEACDGAGGCVSTCNPNFCLVCREGQCVHGCTSCERCDGNGQCVPACEDSFCEVCNGAPWGCDVTCAGSGVCEPLGGPECTPCLPGSSDCHGFSCVDDGWYDLGYHCCPGGYLQEPGKPCPCYVCSPEQRAAYPDSCCD